MGQTRHKGIIAYGTEQDREKLALLAQLSGRSGSELIIEMIRDRYSSLFGDTDPRYVTMTRSE